MKKARNELLEFLGGLAMLIAGLYILSQRVMVSTSWFSIGRFQMTGGMIFIPFIIGVVWMFASDSIGGKILSAAGLLFIVISVILSVNIRVMSMTMFDWVLLLVLIFGGLGLLCKVLFAGGDKEKK